MRIWRWTMSIFRLSFAMPDGVHLFRESLRRLCEVALNGNGNLETVSSEESAEILERLNEEKDLIMVRIWDHLWC